MELHNFLSGFLVIIPDYYRSGKFCDVTKESGETIQAFLKEHSVLANLKKDFDTFILPYVEKNGCKSIGTFGFCWGSVPVIHFSSFDQVSDHKLCKMMVCSRRCLQPSVEPRQSLVVNLAPGFREMFEKDTETIYEVA